MQKRFLRPSDIDLCVLHRDVFVVALKRRDSSAKLGFVEFCHRRQLKCAGVQSDTFTTVIGDELADRAAETGAEIDHGLIWSD